MQHDDVPDDVWSSIFEHLPVAILVRNARVCRRWKEISEDEALWARLWRRMYSMDPPATNIRQEFLQGGRLSKGEPELIGKSVAHSSGAARCLILPDSQALSCGKDGAIRLWNFDRHAVNSERFFVEKWNNKLESNTSHYTICYDRLTQRAVTCGEQGYVNLYDLENRVRVGSATRHTDTAFGLAFVSPDVFVSAGLDATVQVHSAVDMSPIAKVNVGGQVYAVQKRFPHQRACDQLAVFCSPLASGAGGSVHSSLKVLDMNTLQVTVIHPNLCSGFGSMSDDLISGSVGANGVFFTGTRNGLLFRVDSREPTAAVTAVNNVNMGAVLDLAVTDYYALLAEARGTIQLWDHRMSERVWEKKVCQHGARGLDLNLSEGLVSVGSWDTHIYMFRLGSNV